jgi:hypothetical protein
MKLSNLLKKTLLVTLFISLSGCEADLLDTYPKNELSNANFWVSEKDAVSAVNAMYAFLPGYSEVEWDRFSDIATTNSPAAETIQIEMGEHNSSTARFTSNWNEGYSAIRAANYFIENVDKVLEAEPSLEEEAIKRYKAEARFIRAFFYVRLVMLFGDVPLITQILDEAEARDQTRTPQEQIWNFVDAELTEIANHLPNAYTGEDLGRITKGAALAMNARAMLYAERWSEAAEAAKAVIDMNEYSLYPNYGDLFSYDGQNNSEIILDRQYAPAVSSHNFFEQSAPVSLGGDVGISPTRNLADSFETVNGLSISEDPAFDPLNPYAGRDPRLDHTLFIPTFSDDVPGETLFNGRIYDPRPGSGTGDEVEVDFFRTKTGFSMDKYINEEDMIDPGNGGVNFILIRYADVLLMYVEAKIEAGQIDNSVYEAINKVRGRVNMPSVQSELGGTELLEIVRQERMVELALEGLRFFDLRRWRTAEEVMNGAIGGMDYIPVGEATELSNISTLLYSGTLRSFDSGRDYLFPIPQQEMLLVPGLEQNPGY